MRIAIKFAYDGRIFKGYARQPKLKTDEGTIIKNLMKLGFIKNIEESFFRSASRTDKGVSAICNVFAFNTDVFIKNRLQVLSNKFKDIIIYGIKVVEWHTPFGMINLMTHPLFSYETTNANTMVVFEPRDLIYRYITDTTFYPDPDKKNTGRGRIDGTDEEYLTECGLEFHHFEKTGYFNGFGSDNGTP